MPDLTPGSTPIVASEAGQGPVFLPCDPNSRMGMFLSKCVLDPQTRCFLWKGKTLKGRSPVFKVYGAEKSALREAWELFRGRPPVGGAFRHTCGNKLCVNPYHLRHPKYDENERLKGRQGRLSKLTPEGLLEIQTSLQSRRYLARKYDISEWYVWALRKGRKHPIVAREIAHDLRERRGIERADFLRRAMGLLKELEHHAT